MNDCIAFNHNMTLSDNINSVGQDFMYNCKALTATITINTDYTNFDASSSTPLTFATDDQSAACVTTGITIAGSSQQNFMARFPNMKVSAGGPYYRILKTGA